MKLSKIKIKNFKCYGDNEVIINVKEDLTAFVGANSTGKSATFQALLKIFVYGLFFNGSTSYFRNIWNVFDYTIVICSVRLILLKF